MTKTGPKPFTYEQVVEAFYKKIDKTSSPFGCWLWTGQRHHGAYGSVAGAPEKAAHRFSMMLHLGRPLLKTECVLHDCPGGDNPACVNPDHLWLGTRADNNRDKCEKGRWRGWPVRYGTDNHMTKLSDELVLEILEEIKQGGRGTQRKIAKRLGVSDGLISMIKNGQVRPRITQQ